MARYSGRGHGKLILTGEHAVVYGYPALAVAVDRGVTVHIEPTPGPTRPAPGVPSDARLIEALIAVLGPDGWRVTLESDLPWGRGMGSSAAIAVGVTRALAASAGRVCPPDELFARAFAVERVFHGNPSGLDQAVSARGGAIRYQRSNPGSTDTPQAVVRAIPPPPYPLIVLDSGQAGDTRALVAAVAARRPAVDADLAEIGELCALIEGELASPARLGPLLTHNHELLRRIGVSNQTLDDLVRSAIRAGAAGAKLAGAGGGGVVVAVATDPATVLDQLQHHGISCFLTWPAPTNPET